jgi:hypothetical protein
VSRFDGSFAFEFADEVLGGFGSHEWCRAGVAALVFAHTTASRSSTLRKDPRRIVWLVMPPKKISTMSSQELWPAPGEMRSGPQIRGQPGP